MTTTDFAGYYRVTAQTLFRDVATGEDHAAVITIPKAKLQSNISLSMAPNGDPAAFTFTFDAFNDGSGELCYIDVAENATDVNVSVATTVIVYQTNGTVISVVGTEPTDQTTTETTLTYDENGGKIKLGEKEVITLASGQEFTDMRRSLSSTQRTAITVPAGSTTTWFVI